VEQSTRPAVDPRVTAAYDEMRPYAAAAAGIALLGAPADVIVPIVRRLRGRPGVAVGPGLVTLSHSLLALGVVHVVRQDPARLARLKERRPSRWLLAVRLYLLLSPAAASERVIVLRHRSPLWGEAVHPAGWLQLLVLLATISRARRPRQEGAAAPHPS
jgi:hypothetical protein